MIDNVYELKQRFVGFNKVKLLTVVFYCMTYSWCSFLNEYNAMETHPEEEKEEQKEEKGKWSVVEDAVVYRGDTFTVTYKWDNDFWNFISLLNLNPDNNELPAGYDRASKFVGLLYRYRYILGIAVDDEVEYEKVDLKELAGCCISCCNGKLRDGNLLRASIRKKKKLEERMRYIDLMGGHNANAVWKKWMGDISEIDMCSLSSDKLALVVITNLFDQRKVVDNGQTVLLLSDKVKKLIHESPDYINVSFSNYDYISLEGVIVVKKEKTENIAS